MESGSDHFDQGMPQAEGQGQILMAAPAASQPLTLSNLRLQLQYHQQQVKYHRQKQLQVLYHHQQTAVAGTRPDGGLEDANVQKWSQISGVFFGGKEEEKARGIVGVCTPMFGVLEICPVFLTTLD
ncbi:OLC1v1038951C1 [Oldenlandia corymbosa var. corymbosa]|uniref:OLC1v1038951C1 n=1 Tax=Oldenlandia corymbosa var. corymbosa TaxID=529605 RepID=A0AAV1D1H4_OLDCO|nr:OLC1v1038951C1 [Oldenlandia corymbosa var. corymbosa]